MDDIVVPFRLVGGVWKEDEVDYFSSNDLTMLSEVAHATMREQVSVEYNGQHLDVTLYVAPDGVTGYVLAKELTS